AIDETAAKRGQNYISLFVDMDTRKVVFVTEGNDAETVARFADHVDDHNSDASRIKEVCSDMSAAYIKGVTENLTEAEITFDKFHAVKLVNDAVDQVRSCLIIPALIESIFSDRIAVDSAHPPWSTSDRPMHMKNQFRTCILVR